MCNRKGEKFLDRGSNPGRLRDRPILYHVAIKASFYSDMVECRTLNPADRVRSPVRENVSWMFFSFLITYLTNQ